MVDGTPFTNTETSESPAPKPRVMESTSPLGIDGAESALSAYIALATVVSSCATVQTSVTGASAVTPPTDVVYMCLLLAGLSLPSKSAESGCVPSTLLGKGYTVAASNFQSAPTRRKRPPPHSISSTVSGYACPFSTRTHSEYLKFDHDVSNDVRTFSPL